MNRSRAMIVLLVCIMACGSVPVLSGTGVNGEPSREISPMSNRTILIEAFTATWCPYCVYESQALHQIEGEFPREKLIIAEWHTKDNYDPVDGSKVERYNYYGVTGIPTVVFDGVAKIVGAGSKQEAYDQYKNQIYARMGILGQVSILQNSTFIGSNLTVNLTIDPENSNGQYNVRVLLVDNLNIVDADHNVDWVVRKTILNTNVTLASGQNISLNGSATIDQKWNKAHLYTIAFVQDYGGKQVLNSNLAKLKYGGIDNTPPAITDIQIQPSAPKETDKVKVSATILDDAFVDSATLYYDDGSGEKSTPMSSKDNTYEASIGPFSANSTVTYSIEAKDNSGNSARSKNASFFVRPIDRIPPVISNVTYSPLRPTNLDKVSISAVIEDDSGSIASASVYYDDGTGVRSEGMTASGKNYSAKIGPFIAGRTVRFHIEAMDPTNNLGKSSEISFSVKAPDTVPPVIDNIRYTPLTPTEKDIVTISATITDNDEVASATLHYNDGSGDRTSVLTPNGTAYSTEIGPFPAGKTVTFFIEAEDASGNIKKSPEGSFVVEGAKYPDISVKEITLSSPPRVGEEVTISATIVNEGSGDAYAVTVTFFVDGGVIATKNISTLSAGNQIVVSAVWKVDKEGERKIVVEAKTTGDVNSGNDARSQTVTAVSAMETAQVAIYAIPVICVIAVAVAIILLMRKKGKSPGTEKHEKEKKDIEQETRGS